MYFKSIYREISSVVFFMQLLQNWIVVVVVVVDGVYLNKLYRRILTSELW